MTSWRLSSNRHDADLPGSAGALDPVAMLADSGRAARAEPALGLTFGALAARRLGAVAALAIMTLAIAAR
ncbi:hypothetical protein ACE4Z6_27575, partial [Salmonella enterica]|uniref:hypothetical protein n=1 Tax=Salmonella enterica TaxID=28901 RepID=UPI003D294D73